MLVANRKPADKRVLLCHSPSCAGSAFRPQDWQGQRLCQLLQLYGARGKRGEEEELISILTNRMGSRAPHSKHSPIPGGRLWWRALPTLPEVTWDVLVEVPHTGWCLGSKIPSSVSLLHHPSCFPDFLPSLARVFSSRTNYMNSFFQTSLFSIPSIENPSLELCSAIQSQSPSTKQ